MILVGVASLELRHQFPLLGSGHEAYIAVGRDALAMKNHLHGGVLLVDENRVERAVVKHHVKALRRQITCVGDLHRDVSAQSGQRDQENQSEQEAGGHEGFSGD